MKDELRSSSPRATPRLDPRTSARAYGVAIELADLGTWGDATLVSEYDPDGPVIRINSRAIPAGSSCDVREHIDRAVAHELYHHREAIGEVPRSANHKARERAAGEHAR
jgi:hypothetical protein